MKAYTVKKTRLAAGLFSPVLGPLMLNRQAVALLAAVTVILTALNSFGLTAWPCPVKLILGVDGPGCGLTRAMVLLVQGRWRDAVHLHAFAPIGLGAGIFLVAASALPARLQHKVARNLATFEKRTGIVALLVLSALIYWIYRIMIHS